MYYLPITNEMAFIGKIFIIVNFCVTKTDDDDEFSLLSEL